MTGRRLFAIACIVSVPVALAAACSFPDVDFTGRANDGGNDSAREDGQADGSGDADNLPDVIDRDDATQRIDAEACKGVCDCDNDGYVVDAACPPGDAGPDARLDCDDYDPLRNPGVLDFIRAVPVGHDGDWDCNGTVDKAYGEKDCSPCNGGSFKVETPCGVKRDFYDCTQQLLSCDKRLEDEGRKQGCR